MVKFFFFISVLAAAGYPDKKLCLGPHTRLLSHSIAVLATPDSLRFEDRSHPNFSGHAAIDAQGILRIGFTTASSFGRSDIHIKECVIKMLNHFQGRVNSVEVTLSRGTTLDDSTREVSKDPELDKFNEALRNLSRSREQEMIRAVSGMDTAEQNGKFIREAAIYTTYGEMIFGRAGFSKISLADSLGKPGNYTFVRLRFEK